MPDKIKKINTGNFAFKLMENIQNFTQACKEYGLSDAETFQTVDLWDGENMHQVCVCVQALGRKAQKNGLKGIGPKEVTLSLSFVLSYDISSYPLNLIFYYLHRHTETSAHSLASSCKRARRSSVSNTARTSLPTRVASILATIGTCKLCICALRSHFSSISRRNSNSSSLPISSFVCLCVSSYNFIFVCICLSACHLHFYMK